LRASNTSEHGSRTARGAACNPSAVNCCRCANAQVTLEGLIADAEAARAKAMAETGGAPAAVSALIAKAKLAGLWREKAEKTKSGPVIMEVHWPHMKQ
jgi:hypothetical protein